MPRFSFRPTFHHTFRPKYLKTILTTPAPTFISNRSKILQCFVTLALHTGHLYALNPFLSNQSYIDKLSQNWSHKILIDIGLPEEVKGAMLGHISLDMDDPWDVTAIIVDLWKLAARYRREGDLPNEGDLARRVAAKVLKYGLKVLNTNDLGVELVDELMYGRRENPGVREYIRVTMEMKKNGAWVYSTWIEMPFLSAAPEVEAPTGPIDLDEVVEMCHGVDRTNDGDCTICFDKFVRKVRIIRCEHCFCAGCLESWVEVGTGANNCCPLCRTSLRA